MWKNVQITAYIDMESAGIDLNVIVPNIIEFSQWQRKYLRLDRIAMMLMSPHPHFTVPKTRHCCIDDRIDGWRKYLMKNHNSICFQDFTLATFLSLFGLTFGV